MDYESRIDEVRDVLEERGKDAFIAVGGPDCFYLSGFYTDSGSSYPVVVVPRDGDATLYVSAVDRSASDDSAIPVRIPDTKIVKALQDDLEAEELLVGGNIDVGMFSSLKENLDAEVDGGIVSAMREVKDEEELERIKTAYDVTEDAVEALVQEFEGGVEREIAARLEYNMRLNGSDGTPFPTIVAAGAATATPHHATGDTAVEGPLLLDLGARIGGYVSDVSRTLHIGEPDDRYREVYDAVREAQQAAASVLEAGVPAADVDGAAREALEENGLADSFIHSTGHGVGISVHEAPNLHKDADEELEAGMVVTVEPGVYLEGEFGVRIEDAYIVQENGAERITSLPRDIEDTIIRV
ncbi:MAG: Xaa-Pro peptidase family protein [Candidatus Nanohaloarchaea archaeon]|nr:Xaa-Pro peptidase family protein [Candidatus Nanohaloarchaea archaeon]